MGWTSTLVRVGSLEFSTPSYLPITTFPFPLGFRCIAFFSPLLAPFERNSSNLVELCNANSFQVSSKFQAMCVVFHLFSFESLASFKNKRRTEKSEEENWYFLLLHFFTSSLVKKNCNTSRRGFLLLTEKRMHFFEKMVIFVVLFARSSHQHMFLR